MTNLYQEIKKQELKTTKRYLDKMKNGTIKSTFAANLQYYMKLRGVSVTDLAKVIGVAYSTASEWAHGKKYPRPDKLEKISVYLNVSLAALTHFPDEGFETMNELQRIQNQLKDRPETKVLFDLSQKATPAEVEAAIQMLTALTKNKE